ncbi:MAG: lipopolysaccharide biosynthesis protein [Planctomycetota bacterium]
MSVIFIRIAGKELYGQYLFVIAIVGLFSITSISGSKIVVLRTVAQGYDGVYRKATRFSFLWSLLGIPALIVTGILFCLFKTKTLGISLMIAALFFPFVTSLENWVLFLKGRSEFWKLALFNLARFLTSLLAITAAILFTRNLVVILLAYFVVHSIFNTYYHLKCLNSLGYQKIDSGWKKQSYALTIMELSSVVFGKVDILLVAAFLPMEQVAIYGIVMKLVGVFLTATKNMVEAILPKIFMLEKITISYFYKFFLLSFLVPIVLVLIVRYPIIWIYGTECSELVPFTQLYLFVIPIYFLFSLASHFMIKYQMNKEINYSTILGIVAVTILYLVLIPIYGIWGGIVSSILFFAIHTAISLMFLKKLTDTSQKTISNMSTLSY